MNEGRRPGPGVEDGMLVVGVLMLAVGLGAYDWRLALIACGILLLAGGVWLGW